MKSGTSPVPKVRARETLHYSSHAFYPNGADVGQSPSSEHERQMNDKFKLGSDRGTYKCGLKADEPKLRYILNFT